MRAHRPFERVLVANRGEIACRVISALRARGQHSVAVFSEADADAPHAVMADEAVAIGPSPVAESYLNQDVILAVARERGVDAVHPGYGLLSENAEFARRCGRAGVVFVGPPPEVLEALGDKAAAREAVRALGIPVVPGSDGPVSDEHALELAEAIGYPVLVKAVAGGGGIGMAVVKRPQKLARALRSCRDRGRVAFGDDAVYLEKYVASPRHVEVQILFDAHGHGVHLFERECTLQRRHQKVVEEAPSPFVSERPALRTALCDAALKIGSALGYEGAGTVEFIVDPTGAWYFIEANARLQVEHPVTEAITGVDLVRWQLDIAAGAPLSLRQAELTIDGAAVEARLYAEAPLRKFAPRPGRLTRFSAPTGLRVDSGVRSAMDITPFYDPLLAKLVAHEPHRPRALEALRGALGDLVVEGLDTNRQFLQQVLGSEDVGAGRFDTGWLERFARQVVDLR